MKKFILVLALAVVFATTAQAQDITPFLENEKVRAELSLTDRDIETLSTLWAETEKNIRLTAADREIKTSELKRLLLEEKVDMSAVKKALREGMELEFSIRLLEIDRVVKAREVLGEKRWADLHRMIRSYREKHRDRGGDRRPNPDRGPRDFSPPPGPR